MESIRTTMNECIGIDKPLISILMAVYEPDLKWLKEQLLSLNRQTYPNLRLYVRDDASPTVSFEEIQSCVQDCISAFPVIIRRNQRNLGSNLTFQLLTQEGEGKYFAYCDQDDVWLPEKLDVLFTNAEYTGALLVCSDMYVIDGAGTTVADSITKVRRHHKFISGENLSPHLIFSNFVTGCTMLVQASMAKEAIPFCPYYIHDQYLALFCSERGAIVSLQQPLIRYRIHGNNQTIDMVGVVDKTSYLEVRIGIVQKRLHWLATHFKSSELFRQTLKAGLCWANAREKNWHHRGGIVDIVRYRRFGPLVSLFELIGTWLPNPIFMWIIELKRKNIL